MNFDQTPLKYALVLNSNLVKKKDQNISLLPVVLLKNQLLLLLASPIQMFLPMQLICKGKTRRSFPLGNFPPSFLLSANIKYFSNMQESMKLLDQIMIPYVEKERIYLIWTKSNQHF